MERNIVEAINERFEKSTSNTTRFVVYSLDTPEVVDVVFVIVVINKMWLKKREKIFFCLRKKELNNEKKNV